MKQRKHTRTHIPMMRETRQKIAIKMHLMAEEMIGRPSATAAGELSKSMAIMTAAIDNSSAVNIIHRKDPVALSLIASLNTMVEIEARHDKIGKWGITGDQAVVIRAAAARFDEALARVPYNVYLAAAYFINMTLQEALIHSRSQP